MKQIIILLSILFTITACNSEDKSDPTIQLDNWTDSVLTNTLNQNIIFDSIVEKGNQRKRIWKSNSNREEYLLIDDMDTLVRTVELKDSKIRIINEYCVDGKNPKSLSKILVNGKSHGRIMINYCDRDSISKEYYINNLLIEK